MSVVEFEVREKVAYVTLNRPEKLNAINHDVLDGCTEAFDEVKFNPDIWGMVITGTGRAFSTGHDLVEQFLARIEFLPDRVVRIVAVLANEQHPVHRHRGTSVA